MKDKFLAFRNLWKSTNFTVVTIRADKIDSVNHTEELEDSLLLAVTVKQTYNALVKEIDRIAKEQGEPATLSALREVINVVETETNPLT